MLSFSFPKFLLVDARCHRRRDGLDGVDDEVFHNQATSRLPCRSLQISRRVPPQATGLATTPTFTPLEYTLNLYRNDDNMMVYVVIGVYRQL